MRCPRCSSEMKWIEAIEGGWYGCLCGCHASAEFAVDQAREDQDDDELDSYRKGIGDATT